MTKIPVKFLNFNKESPSKGYWDMYLLEKFFSNKPFKVLDDDDIELEMIVVIPARHNYDHIDQINNYLAALNGVLLIIAGDEEGLFELDKIKHPNMKLWLMTPQAGREYKNVDRFIGEGVTPHTELLPKEPPVKDVRWFFSGQVTHGRRFECVNTLQAINDHTEHKGQLNKTDGFTKGLSVEEYISKMATARVIPCPSGPVTPDTFRFYEALESGCIPIADVYSSSNSNSNYWALLFGENFPFPTIKEYNDLQDLINYYNDTFEVNSNKVFAWWIMYKRNLKNGLIDDFESISSFRKNTNGITAIIPTSPSKLHPDTSIIEESIKSIRAHLPTEEIIITFDGVRKEQEHLTEQYNEYIRRVLWKINREYTNIVPILFENHTHQVGMMREALKHVRTDKILYVEHDTPLTADMPIDFESVSKMIDTKTADLIRFHFEAFIPKEHDSLIVSEPINHFGMDYVKTIQWSQRPHVASVEFYNRVLQHFSPDAISFIEDWLHSVVINAYKIEQMQGWNRFKIWIYHPKGGNIKRSYHTDGRAGEDKYSMKF